MLLKIGVKMSQSTDTNRGREVRHARKVMISFQKRKRSPRNVTQCRTSQTVKKHKILKTFLNFYFKICNSLIRFLWVFARDVTTRFSVTNCQRFDLLKTHESKKFFVVEAYFFLFSLLLHHHNEYEWDWQVNFLKQRVFKSHQEGNFFRNLPGHREKKNDLVI